LTESILELPTISKKEIEGAIMTFRFNVYKHYDVKKAFAEKIGIEALKRTIVCYLRKAGLKRKF
jgi:hypothetical protein